MSDQYGNNRQYMSSSNSYGNYGNYNNPYNSLPRGLLVFAQVAGTVFSVLGLIVYIYFMQKIYNSLPGDDLTNKSITALLLAVIVYFMWKSIYTAIVIIRLAKRSSDEELCANRYIISALSLGVGGLFTPFIITRFPNVDTTSTIKPRFFLSKVMGLCILIGAPIFALSYFLPLLVGTNSVANLQVIFATASTMGIISSVVLSLTIVAIVLGITTTAMFFSKKTENAYQLENKPSAVLNIISTIWMIVLTLELVLVIVMAIVRLIGAISDFFRAGENGGAIMMLFAIMNLFITFSYVGMVIYITGKTMSGLWSIDGNITIGKYQHNNYAQSRMGQRNPNI